MQKITRETLVDYACEALSSGRADMLVGWRRGELWQDVTPSVFKTTEDIKSNFVFDSLCSPNLSKTLSNVLKNTEGRALVFLKSCDSYSLARLIADNAVARERVLAVGVPCGGMIDNFLVLHEREDAIAIKENGGEITIFGTDGQAKVDIDSLLAERCLNCKDQTPIDCDELLGDGFSSARGDRFEEVISLENKPAEERFEFWRGELSRCIRCNACRNACPACLCEKCVFDNPASGAENKAPASEFEEKFFHIIRAFHVAGRCTDCGECSRVCPERIPLHLINRKLILDSTRLYGEQTGDAPPLYAFSPDDPEPAAFFGGDANA